MSGKIFRGAVVAGASLVIGLYLLSQGFHPPSPPGDPRDIQIPASTDTAMPIQGEDDARETQTPPQAADEAPLSLPPRAATPQPAEPAKEPAEPAKEPAVAASVREPAKKSAAAAKAPNPAERARRDLERAEQLRAARPFYEWQWQQRRAGESVEADRPAVAAPSPSAEMPAASPN